MLRTDYLPRICAAGVVNDVFTNGRKAFEVGAPPTDVPTMPIEFSVAAFRLGHSMVRAAYNWNKVFDDGQPARSTSCSTFSAPERRPRRRDAPAQHLDRRLPPPLRLRRGRPQPTSSCRRQVQPRDADRHLLVDPLEAPAAEHRSAAPAMPFDDPDNLAFRNLTRAQHGHAGHRAADGRPS